MQVIVLTPAELQSIITSSVKQALSEFKTSEVPKPEAQEEYMNLDQVCKFLDLKKSTIYNYVNLKLIPVNKRGGKLYFSRTKINEWLNAGSLETRQDIRKSVLNDIKKRR